MASSEERMRILSMLQEGKVTAEEANRLLSALNQAAKASGPKRTPRQLRVRITDVNTGRAKVNVNIPMGLVNIGLKMGARFIPSDANIDVESVKEAISNGQMGKIVDMEDIEDGERVEVWVE